MISICGDIEDHHMRNLFTTAVLAIAVLAATVSAASAHHGWAWTTGGNISLTGIIETVKLGNPHGVITVDAEGEIWTVEVGQPWRNENAGIKPGQLAVGAEVRIVGEPSADVKEKLMKAEKIYIDGKEHKLYPYRD